MRCDVAVVGLGAMGSGALWRTAARGARVIGFEQFQPGHDRGSSHGDSRIIRTAYYESPGYVPLVQCAFPLWRRLERESGVPLLTMTGALMIGRLDGELVAGSLGSARGHGLAHELLDGAQMRRRFPQFRLASDEVALYEEQAGIPRPEDAVKAMTARAESLGAVVKQEATVTSLGCDRDGAYVEAGGERYRARHVVVTAGMWLPGLLSRWRIPLEIERQVFAWWPVRDPALFSPAVMPVFMHEIAPGQFRYGISSLDGVTVKVGVHHEGAVATPETLDRTIDAGDLEPIAGYLRTVLPDVGPTAARAKVCVYTNTVDRHFLIGSPPGMPAVSVLSVCSGHGFKYAPVMGDIAADLALDGNTGYPIDQFTPDRFAAARTEERV